MALLVVANAVPLIGVAFFGWDVASILILYWLENGIVGLLNIPRILLAAGPSTTQITGLGKSNAGLAAFFVVHYGLFWFVHGVFLVVLTGIVEQPDLADPLRVILGDPRLLLAGLALFISHAANLWLNYIGRGEFRTRSPGSQMFQPYPRLIVLHLMITAGALLIIGRQSVLAVGLLVVLKTGIDLILYMLERRRQQARDKAARSAA